MKNWKKIHRKTKGFGITRIDRLTETISKDFLAKLVKDFRLLLYGFYTIYVSIRCII